MCLVLTAPGCHTVLLPPRLQAGLGKDTHVTVMRIKVFQLVFCKSQPQPEFKSLRPASMLQRKPLAFCLEAVVSLQRSDTCPHEPELELSNQMRAWALLTEKLWLRGLSHLCKKDFDSLTEINRASMELLAGDTPFYPIPLDIHHCVLPIHTGDPTGASDPTGDPTCCSQLYAGPKVWFLTIVANHYMYGNISIWSYKGSSKGHRETKRMFPTPQETQPVVLNPMVDPSYGS